MSDSYTEYTSESGLSRIGSSFKGVLVGLVMCALAPIGLWWNEGRAVDAATGLAEGEKKCVSVPADKGESSGQLVLAHVQGKATTDEVLQDPTFPVKANALVLLRKVEMYQWVEEKESKSRDKLGGGKETKTTYTYEHKWVDRAVDSDKFKKPDGHRNPPMPYRSLSVFARSAKLGKFELSESLLRAIGGEVPLAVTDEMTRTMPAEAVAYRAQDGKLLKGIVSSPRVGDVRISFAVVQPQEISVVAGAQSDRFTDYKCSNGYTILLVERGQKDAKTMFENAKTVEAALTWILRFVGFIVLWIGISMLFGPIVAIARVIPLFGSLVGSGVGLFAFVMAACISCGVIAVAWFAHRPLLSLALLGGAAVLLFLAKSSAGNRKAA